MVPDADDETLGVRGTNSRRRISHPPVRAQVVISHADDETLGIGGTIARGAAEAASEHGESVKARGLVIGPTLERSLHARR